MPLLTMKYTCRMSISFVFRKSGGFMLELYQFEQCPYCKKVRTALSDLNLDYICRNVPKMTKKREILTTLGGQDQVPFLVDLDKGVMMYESDEIVKYLEKTYG